MKAILIVLCAALSGCAGWQAPSFSLGITDRAGRQYRGAFDGRTVALDLRLPGDIALRK